MSTENKKTNESHKFSITLADKLNLEDPHENMALANFSIYYTWKTLSLHITTINLKSLFQLGMMSLICLMNHLFLTFKIILSILKT